jgi:hypothetical protein
LSGGKSSGLLIYSNGSGVFGAGGASFEGAAFQRNEACVNIITLLDSVLPFVLGSVVTTPWPWFFSLGIGLPLFALLYFYFGERAQTSVLDRFLLCLVLAAATTPSVFLFSTGHSGIYLVVPAAFVVPAALIMLIDQMDPSLAIYGLVFGVLPLVVVSLVFFGVWSLRTKRKRLNAV